MPRGATVIPNIWCVEDQYSTVIILTLEPEGLLRATRTSTRIQTNSGQNGSWAFIPTKTSYVILAGTSLGMGDGMSWGFCHRLESR